MTSSTDVSHNKSAEVAFNAVRQFVIAPDRRYTVGLRGDSLIFKQSGGQFDRDWLLKGLEAGIASKVLPQWMRSRLTKLAHGSRKGLLLTGIGLIVVSVLLLVVVVLAAPPANAPTIRTSRFMRQILLILPILFILFVAGCVFSIVGLLSMNPTDKSRVASGQAFRIPLETIEKAKFVKGEGGIQAQLRAGGGQVALLELYPRYGKPLKLAIPTDSDLATVERYLIDRLRVVTR